MGLSTAAAWGARPPRKAGDPEFASKSKLGLVAALRRAIAAITISFGLMTLVLLALGASPLGVFAALFEGAFGGYFAITETIVRATPLVFTGLAVAIAFQGAIYNIGADGQLLIGALAAAAI